MTEQDEALILDYVLGELDEFSSARLEARLSQEPELVAALNRCEETVAQGLLADTPDVAPGPGLADKVAAMAATPTHSQPKAGSMAPTSSGRGLALTGWAAAAAFAVMSVLFYNQVGDRETEVKALQARVAQERETLMEVSSELAAVMDERELLANRIAQLNSKRALDQMRIATLSSELERASYGFAVFDTEANEGVIEVVNLPKIESTQDYQLWVVDPQYPNPVDGGIVQIDTSGRASVRFKSKQPVENVAAFAISLEKKGGVPVAEGPMVLVGSL